MLGISELALRQRIRCLRKAWKASGADGYAELAFTGCSNYRDSAGYSPA